MLQNKFCPVCGIKNTTPAQLIRQVIVVFILIEARSHFFERDLRWINAQLCSASPSAFYKSFVGRNICRIRADVWQSIGNCCGFWSDAKNVRNRSRIIRPLVFPNKKVICRGLGKSFALKRSENNRIGNYRRRKWMRRKSFVNPKTFRQIVRRRLPYNFGICGKVRRKVSWRIREIGEGGKSCCKNGCEK